jgi:hypothetical protein
MPAAAAELALPGRWRALQAAPGLAARPLARHPRSTGPCVSWLGPLRGDGTSTRSEKSKRGWSHFIAAGSQMAVSGRAISSAISTTMLAMKGRQPVITSPMLMLPRLMPWIT